MLPQTMIPKHIIPMSNTQKVYLSIHINAVEKWVTNLYFQIHQMGVYIESKYKLKTLFFATYEHINTW
jgi:hypothetical protein